MSRYVDRKEEKDIKEVFQSGLLSEFERNIGLMSGSKDLNIMSSIWREKPPSIEEFFTNWFPEPLWPEQLVFLKAMIGEDPLLWNTDYDEGHAYWGKGAGKDRTIAKGLNYLCVKLDHMVSPQVGMNYYLGEKGGLGIDSPIDIINVSKDARQAKNVFFKNIKIIMKRTINPKTKKNYWAGRGVDLRDGKDIQTVEIRLPNNVTLHSLNSKEYAGEGLNIFMAVVDELGSFPSYEKVSTQLDSIRRTITSRFPLIGKLFWLSFQYGQNCPATIEYNLGKGDERVFSHNKTTWQVNITKSKSDFFRDYKRNVEKAIMTYECRGTGEIGGFIKIKNAIKKCISVGWKDNPGMGENPIVGNELTTDAPMFLNFKPWFKGLVGKTYSIHVDLAGGKVDQKNDAAGFHMCHPENMLPQYDKKYIEVLKRNGIMVQKDNPISQKGIMIDLALQIIAPKDGEIQLDDITNFVLTLKQMYGFNIRYVTYDGWESLGSIQKLNVHGIESYKLSVDKDDSPYTTLKELIYQTLYRGYEQSILVRELGELDRDDNGKIDHPAKSYVRFQQEGYEKGSKDVSDAAAGSVYTCMEKISTDLQCGFG